RDDDDEDDDDRPRNKSKRRDDDDDDEDDRPRKKSKRRDDDDDEDDDDRPRKKSKRRDDDDDEEDDEPRQNPKKRKAAFRKAALGVNLISIGLWVTIGALCLGVLMSLLMGAVFGSRSGGSKTMGDILNILGFLIAIVVLAGVILRIIGSAFIITTP